MPDHRATVRAGIGAGKSYAAIGRQLGLTRVRVRQLATEMGLQSSAAIRRATAARHRADAIAARREARAALAKARQIVLDEGVRRVADGATIRRVSDDTGLPYNALVRACAAAGVVSPGRTRTDRSAEKAKARKLLAKGVSRAEAARQTGLSLPTIDRVRAEMRR